MFMVLKNKIQDNKPYLRKLKLPGFAKIRTRSILGLRAATASATHAPKDSPTRYMGLFGDRWYSDLTVLSTIFTMSARGEYTKHKL